MDQKQIEYRKVSGNYNDVAQSFFSNRNVNYYQSNRLINNFEIPIYSATGGTLNYYGQDPQATFTNLNNPFIRYFFSANTFSISANTSVLFRVYKLDYTTYKNYQPDFTKINTDQKNIVNQQIQEETIIVNGEKTITTKITNTINTATTENAAKIDLSSKDDIQNLLENPFYELEIPYSSITIPYYDLIFPVFVKSTGMTSGNLTNKLFEDKSQYFVKTIFKFNFPISNNYISSNKIYTEIQSQEFSDFMLNEQLVYSSYYDYGQIYNITSYNYTNNINDFNVSDFPVYSADTFFETPHDSLISAGTFSDFLIGGRFFTYFQIPNKPKIEEPYVQGQLDTFSPKFYYSNIIDGDYSQIEISYGTGFSYSDEIVIYEIEKKLSNDSNIQEAGVSIRADATNFVYRIGNVKKITNIFGVDQRIVTYTDSYSATTQNSPATTFVFTQIDSPYDPVIAPFVNPPNLALSNPGFYSLSGQVSGSVISQCLLTLIYPDSTKISISSDTQGNYAFNGLTYGTYTLITEYRDYDTSYQTFSLKEDKDLGYRIIVLWSSTHDTWADKATDKMGYKLT